MLESMLRMAEDNLVYAEALVSDIEDTHMAEQPAGLTNHPAWTLGHLVVSQDFALQLLEAPSAADPSWVRLFGSGGAPTDDRQNFPLKAELVAALKMEHEKVAAVFRTNFEKRAPSPNPFGPLVPRFPTIGDLVLHLITTHEAAHLGQLSAWRRAKGLPQVSVATKSVVPAADKPAAAAPVKTVEPTTLPDAPVIAMD